MCAYTLLKTRAWDDEINASRRQYSGPTRGTLRDSVFRQSGFTGHLCTLFDNLGPDPVSQWRTLQKLTVLELKLEVQEQVCRCRSGTVTAEPP